MIILDLINSGSQKLKKNQIISNRLDSEILLAKILNKKREEIIVNSSQKVSDDDINSFNSLISRRLSSEPLAYILNEKEFWSKNFYVNKNTLIPRPETELMIEKIVNFFKNKRINILDIGTGTGCILLSILSELTNSSGVGIDISKEAVKVAIKNSHKQKLDHRATFFRKSLSDIFLDKKYDLIVSNPPYVRKIELKNLSDDIKKFEPKLALDGGNDGLDVIKKVIYKSNKILKFNGMLALEIGNEQYKKVSTILKRNNFRVKNLVKDYKNNIRSIISTKEH